MLQNARVYRELAASLLNSAKLSETAEDRDQYLTKAAWLLQLAQGIEDRHGAHASAETAQARLETVSDPVAGAVCVIEATAR